MSIRSIAVTARERTQASTQQPGTPEAWAAAAQAGQGTGGVDSLLKSVPTEVIVMYTTVIGVLTGVIKDDAFATYLPLRWWLYGGCIIATCIAVPLTYQQLKFTAPEQPNGSLVRERPPEVPVAGQSTTASGEDRGQTPTAIERRVPVSETFIAAFSFAVWGLVVPGSPLYVVLSSPTLPVLVTVLSATGAFIASAIFDPWLSRAAERRRTPKA